MPARMLASQKNLARGDIMIANGIQKHHKPPKAVTERLLDFSIIALTSLTGFFLCVNVYAIILTPSIDG